MEASSAANVKHTQGERQPAGFKVMAVGVGCGTKDFPSHPNVVRVFLGSLTDSGTTGVKVHETISPPSSNHLWMEQDLLVLSANIDDLTAELLSHAMQRCLDEGALDAWQVPIVMKKGRLATQISVLCTLSQRERILELLFRETSTIGVRVSTIQRCALRRETRILETPCGPLQAKASYVGEELVTLKPEFDDVRRLASDNSMSARSLLDNI
jgi:uncharacterized protein (DUF111 family)